MTTRRLVLRTLAASAGAALGCSSALAESFPSRPLKLIVPFAAGGSTDILSRIVAERLGTELGQNVIVENRSGGSTIVGMNAAATAPPDGHTLVTMTSNAAVISAVQPKLPFDLARDFTPVLGIGAVPLLVIVPANGGIKSIADLIALAKSSPGGINFASGGIGSLGHLAPVRFLRELKINATHVPYRGVAPAVQEVMSGRIQLMFVSSLEGLQQLRAGGIRALGVTSAKRLPNLPDVPTMIELGFTGFTPEVWYGFLVPSKTPQDIVNRLQGAIKKVILDPPVQAKLADLGLVVSFRNTPEFGSYIREEGERWRKVVVENDIKME